MNRNEIRAIYDETAPSYDRMMRLQERFLMGRLRRDLLRGAAGAILEIAIGTGLSLPYYKPGSTIIGLDLSSETLALARRRALRRGVTLHTIGGDAERLPFPDASFDTVVSMLAGCTFPDPVLAFREMRRVCRPGGQVLLLEHVRVNRPLIGRLQDLITPLTVRKHGCHQNRNTADNVVAAGLQIAASTPSLGGYLLQIEAVR